MEKGRRIAGVVLKALSVVVFFITAAFLFTDVGLAWPDEFDVEPNWGEFIIFGLLVALVGLGAGFFLRLVGTRMLQSVHSRTTSSTRTPDRKHA